MIKIKVNGKTYNVTENELTVKNGKLYNVKTKEYEGVEGDSIIFKNKHSEKTFIVSGTVNGYTCGEHVVLRPNYEYNDAKSKEIEHIMSVSLLEEDDEELSLMTQE